jgi:hypothetical protein
VLRLLRQTAALIIWLACYVPTSILVLIVMLNVVAKSRRQVHVPNIAR